MNYYLLLASLFLCAGYGTAQGPLIVHPDNPNYLMHRDDPMGKAVYLTGSHVWNSIQDWNSNPFCFDDPELNTCYLDDLQSWGHNFVRAWVWENSTVAGRNLQPKLLAQEGGLYNLKTLSPAYLTRLKARIQAAADRGMYVGVMLFQPITYKNADATPDSPYKASNNTVGFSAEDGNHTTLPLSTLDAAGEPVSYPDTDALGKPVTTYPQLAQIDKLVEELSGFDNIIWEIGNEGHDTSFEWQEYLACYIRRLEGANPHLIWISATVSDGNPWQPCWNGEPCVDGLPCPPNQRVPVSVNTRLAQSTADIISPDRGNTTLSNPTAPSGKVVISDTDHLCGTCDAPGALNDAWVWKSFTRGLHTAFMDSVYRDNPWYDAANYDDIAPIHRQVRLAMGMTRTLAEEGNLAAMVPKARGAGATSITSEAYCLYEPQRDYVIYTENPVAWVDIYNLPAGTYSYRWIQADTLQERGADEMTHPGGTLRVGNPRGNLRMVLRVRLEAPEEAVVTSDAFEDAAGPLAGRVTPLGHQVWQTVGGPLIDARGRVTAPGSGNTVTGHVAYGPVDESVLLQANIRAQNPHTDSWAALGFLSEPGTFLNQTAAQLWVLVRPNGVYVVRGAGNTVLAGGTAADFQTDALNRIALGYDPTSRRVRLWVNSQKAVDQVITGTAVPDIHHAGFQLYRSDSHLLDDFEVLPNIATPPCRSVTVQRHPTGTTVTPGSNVVFTVTPGGTAPFAYQWRRNGTALSGETGDTLALIGVTGADEGTYTCTITNVCGTVTSAGAGLQVRQQVAGDLVRTVEDGFSGTAGGLSGPVALGGDTVVWQATGIGRSGGRAANTATGTAVASLPFGMDTNPADTYIVGLTEVRAEVDVVFDNPAVAGAGASWAGLGFGSTHGPFWQNASGGLWLLVRRGGTWSVFVGGTTTQLATGFATLDPGGPTRLALTYNRSAHTVAVAVDGYVLRQGIAVPGQPEIARAGFMAYDESNSLAAGDTTFDDFALFSDALAVDPVQPYGWWNRYALTKPCSWSAAQALAEGMGGYLCTVNAPEEQAWLADPATGFVNFDTSALGIPNCSQPGLDDCSALCDIADSSRVDGLWLGLYRTSPSAAWQWVGPNSTYRNWAPGHPAADTNCPAPGSPANVTVMPSTTFEAANRWFSFASGGVANTMGVIEINR